MLRPTSLAIAAALALGAPAARANPDPTPIAEHQTSPRPASQPETARYAQREHRDHKVANYEGGSVFVIGISGTALIVILVVALVLL